MSTQSENRWRRRFGASCVRNYRGQRDAESGAQIVLRLDRFRRVARRKTVQPTVGWNDSTKHPDAEGSSAVLHVLVDYGALARLIGHRQCTMLALTRVVDASGQEQ